MLNLRLFNRQRFLLIGVFVLWITQCIFYINVRETDEAIRNGQSSETGNIGYTRQIKQNIQHNMCWSLPYTRHITKTSTTINTTQYALDITIRKQTQITQIWHVPSYIQLLQLLLSSSVHLYHYFFLFLFFIFEVLIQFLIIDDCRSI